MPKGPEAFRTISEAAEQLGVPQHVLRFWETKFSFIRPMKRAGGRRFYRPQDLAVLRGVQSLLHNEGYTIKGVQKLHKEHGVRRLILAGEGDSPLHAGSAEGAMDGTASDGLASSVEAMAPAGESQGRLREILGELEIAKARLDGLLRR